MSILEGVLREEEQGEEREEGAGGEGEERGGEEVGCTVHDSPSIFLSLSLPPLILMRFIDPRIFDFNDIHRHHPGPQDNKLVV